MGTTAWPSKTEWAVLGATALYVATGNGEYIFDIAVMFVLVSAVVSVHHRVGFSIGLLAVPDPDHEAQEPMSPYH